VVFYTPVFLWGMAACVLLPLAFFLRRNVLPGGVGAVKACGVPVLLILAGLGFLLWVVLNFTLQGYTSAPFGGVLPGLTLIAAGVGVSPVISFHPHAGRSSGEKRRPTGQRQRWGVGASLFGVIH